MITLEELNRVSAAEFAAALASVFEHSPWIAQRAAPMRPFTSRLNLLDTLRAVIEGSSREHKLSLIRAHPELTGSAVIANGLTLESEYEQRSAGLRACTQQEFSRLKELNAVYRKRFEFPFVLAVRGHTPSSIIASLEQRMHVQPYKEMGTALYQIGCIGAFRLADLIAVSPAFEIMAMIKCLAALSEQDNNLTCSYLSAAHRLTAAQISEWMLVAGMSVEIDAVANVVGRWRCGQLNAKTLITGSHYDTVVNAGHYDGRLGIILPIVIALKLRQSGIELPFDLEIIAFADEEGVRFKSTFIGSSAVAGHFDSALLDATDGSQMSLRSVLLEAGHDPGAIQAIARDPKKLLGYVEVHIEQGPVLLSAHQPLGIVTAIAGSVRYNIIVTGQAGHAGTVPMKLRHDSATATAEMILAIETRCSVVPGLVGTVGRLTVPEGAINVIPGRCDFTLDIRAATDKVRDEALRDVLELISKIASRRQVHVQPQKLMQADTVTCSPWIQQCLSASVTRIIGTEQPVHLPSGAGHDAMMMGRITDMGMLFLRCGNNGISHHPDETLALDDVELAANVFENFLINFRAST